MSGAEPVKWKLPDLRRKPNVTDRLRASYSFALMGVFGLMTMLSGLLKTALMGVDNNPLDFVNDPIGAILFIIGIMVVVIYVILLAARAAPPHPKAIGTVFGLAAVLIVVALLFGQLTTLPGAVAPPASGSGAAVSSYIIAPGGGSGVGNAVPGCSVNSATNVMTCDMDFNYTSNAFYLCSGNLTVGLGRTACIAHNYVLLGIHSARTDVQNATYGFPFAVSSVPTVSSAGTTPTVYSPAVGYTVATGTSPGVWKTNWGSGSTAGLNPTNVAPTSTSNFNPTSLGIGAFGGAVDILHISLPGGNSTFAPTWPTTGTAASSNLGVTLYSTYSVIVTVGNSSPTTFTLNLVLIGFTT